MSFDREEKAHEIEDAAKQPSQEIGGAPAGEPTAFDRIVAAAKQEAEVDPDLVPSNGGVSAAPKASKAGVEESEEAIEASLVLVAARLDKIRNDVRGWRTSDVDEARGIEDDRAQIAEVFAKGEAGLELGKVEYQLAQHKSRSAKVTKHKIKSGVALVKRSMFALEQEVQAARRDKGAKVDTSKLNARIESLDDTLGTSVGRNDAPSPSRKLDVAVNHAYAEQIEAVVVNAKVIKSAQSLQTWQDDKIDTLMAVASHTQAVTVMLPEVDKKQRARAMNLVRELDTMIASVGSRAEAQQALNIARAQTNALRNSL